MLSAVIAIHTNFNTVFWHLQYTLVAVRVLLLIFQFMSQEDGYVLMSHCSLAHFTQEIVTHLKKTNYSSVPFAVVVNNCQADRTNKLYACIKI